MWLMLLSITALAADECDPSSPAGDDLHSVLVNLADSLPLTPVPDPMFTALQGDTDPDCPPPIDVGDGPIEPIPDPSTWGDDWPGATADAELDGGPVPTLADPQERSVLVAPTPAERSVLIIHHDPVPDSETEHFKSPLEELESARDDEAPWTGLPEGAISADDLRSALAHLQAQDANLAAFLALMADGKGRSISGEVIRSMVVEGDELAAILPLDKLDEVVSDGRSLQVRFNTRGAITVEPPAQQVWVYKRGQATRITPKTTPIRLASTLNFTLGPEGISGLRKGDIQAKAGIFGYVSVGLTMEAKPGQIAEVDGYPLLELGDDGQPLRVDGQLRYQRYDHWAVITAPFTRVEVGLPDFSALPDLSVAQK